ncbi:MAG TPA: hypothetical protein VHG92_14880 [Afifellaceae bacterium]|nr:hypothetical protein [Afifellaceae bacterium]
MGSLASLAADPAASQSIICCNQSLSVGGDWVGSGRVDDCQEYFNSAARDILRRMCEQRQYLSCIDTSRCSELPPGEAGSQEPGEGEPWPPDVDRDGISQAFYGPAPRPPDSAPAAPPAMPRRLVYIATLDQLGGRQGRAFMAWLDHLGCAIPLGENNWPVDAAAASHVVRGTVLRRDGRVRIEADAETQARPGGARTRPFTAEAPGEDIAAVAEATRDVLRQMELACRR